MPPTSKKSPLASSALAASQSTHNGFSLISNEKLLALYSTMLKCRMIQQRLQILVNQGKSVSSYPTITGREAALVGVIIDLLPADILSPSPDDLIPSFINGSPLHELIRGLFQPITSSSTVATRLSQATDRARANKLNKNANITVAISPAQPAPRGPWHKSLTFAARHRLPMIFLSWSDAILSKPKADKFPTIPVDGNDVVAVYRVAAEAIVHARKGNGPTLIQCAHFAAADPIRNMEEYLTRKGLFSVNYKTELSAALQTELDSAIEGIQKSTQP